LGQLGNFGTGSPFWTLTPPPDDTGITLIPDIPPRQLLGESQGGTTITVGLPIRTPERPRALPPPQAPSPLPPSSTAPPTLGDGLSKRKRRVRDKYREGREQGDVPSIGHSQLNTTLVGGDEV